MLSGVEVDNGAQWGRQVSVVPSGGRGAFSAHWGGRRGGVVMLSGLDRGQCCSIEWMRALVLSVCGGINGISIEQRGEGG